jgi:hypothetical protein
MKRRKKTTMSTTKTVLEAQWREGLYERVGEKRRKGMKKTKGKKTNWTKWTNKKND